MRGKTREFLQCNLIEYTIGFVTFRFVIDGTPCNLMRLKWVANVVSAEDRVEFEIGHVMHLLVLLGYTF